MRFFLVPISTKRAFIYCRAPKTLKTGYIDRATNKAADTWASWERADKGWKKRLVVYGQVILQRIPYEEWGLKSIPPLNVSREIQEAYQQEKIDVMFPGNAVKAENVLSVLRKLGTERQEFHRNKMWWCLGLSPFTAPVAIIPLYVSSHF
jgi:Mitochondrial K+-H+ exchange-related